MVKAISLRMVKKQQVQRQSIGEDCPVFILMQWMSYLLSAEYTFTMLNLQVQKQINYAPEVISLDGKYISIHCLWFYTVNTTVVNTMSQ